MGGKGILVLLDAKTFRKKVVFLVSSVKKQITPLLAPSWKMFGKIPWWPPL